MPTRKNGTKNINRLTHVFITSKREIMTDLLKDLVKKIEESGARVVFGLEAQGHIPTIERSLERISTGY